jgi:hypothetical protein
MVTKRIAVLLVLGMLAPALENSPAAALSAPGADRPVAASKRDPSTRERPRQARPRVQVSPDRPLYRECVDTTREVWRPYWGYVVMPDMRCWWVRR